MNDSNPGSAQIEFVLGESARLAAERLDHALQAGPGPGATTPRIAGRVSFPEVSVWRSRGRLAPSPFARFDGVIRERGGTSALVGQITVPPSGSLMASVVAISTTAFAALAAVMGVSSGKLVGAVAGLAFAGLALGYLYVARRVARANTMAERDLLIQELRELVGQHAESDS